MRGGPVGVPRADARDDAVPPTHRRTPDPIRRRPSCPARTSPATRPRAAQTCSSRRPYDVALDLTTGPETFRTTTTVAFTCPEPGRRHLHRPHRRLRRRRSPSTARPRPGRRSSTDSRIALPGLRRRERARRRRRPARYTNTGEGLHRFVDPVDDEVYLYTPVRGPRLPAHVSPSSSSPTSRRRFALHGDRARPLEGRLQLPHARARARRRGRRRRARDLVLRADAAHLLATSPRSSPARTTWSRDEVQTPRGRRAARRLLPQVADRSTSTPTTSSTAPSAGFAFFEDEFDQPYPFDEVRPDLHARVQHGRDGERRRRDLHRGLRLPLQGHRGHRSSAAP